MTIADNDQSQVRMWVFKDSHHDFYLIILSKVTHGSRKRTVSHAMSEPKISLWSKTIEWSGLQTRSLTLYRQVIEF